jgi:micrococcal nuclease
MKAIKLLILVPYLMLQIASAFAQNSATVIRVIDGDTYQMLQGKRIFTVRLLNIDAPETKQSFGEAAKDSVSKLILGKTVGIEVVKLDKYKRTLANLSINGKALDSILITNGWAWYYKEYSFKNSLELLQNKAISKRLGLWKCGANKVCQPSVFRSLNVKNRAKYCNACIN